MCSAIHTEPAPRVAPGVAAGSGVDGISRAAVAFPEFIAIAIVACAQRKSEAVEKA